MRVLSLILTLILSFLPLEAAAKSVCGQQHFENALIVSLDSDYSNMSIRDCAPDTAGGPIVCTTCPPISVSVSDAAIQNELKPFRAGDHVRLDLAPHGSGMELRQFRGVWSVPVGWSTRFFVLLICGALMFVPAAIVTGGHPLQFIIGMDNRYSNSKSQVALWFWIATSTYLAAWVFRVWYAGWDFAGLINIPQNLLLVSGLSALTYGGAKAITSSKAGDPDPQVLAMHARVVTNAKAGLADAVNAMKEDQKAGRADVANLDNLNAAMQAADAAAQPVAGLKTSAHTAKFPDDLLKNDMGQFDLGDFQMLMVTLLAAVTYLVLFFHFFQSVAFLRAITLPDVDTTMLSLFGIGQGAYLAKKAGGAAGTA